jgi:hypothetical protein
MPVGIHDTVHMISDKNKACTLLYILVGIHDIVHMIKAYTIMYMLYSFHLIICTVSCIPTVIYNNVHALFFSSYHIYHVMYTYWNIQ